MKTHAPEETKIGLMLSQGLTTKEVANITGKSFHTVNQQKRRLYEKTGSHNLADLTRAMISRYSGINTNEVLNMALRAIAIVIVIAFAGYLSTHPSIMELVRASLHSVFK